MNQSIVLLFALLCTLLGVSAQNNYAPLMNPIDLSHSLDSNSIALVGFMPFHYTKKTTGHWGSKNGPWYTTNEFASSEHTSTTILAPAVIIKGATTVGNLPLSSLVAKGIFLDVSNDVGNNWNYTLPASKLDEWVATNGEIDANTVLIIKYGWSSRYPIKSLFLGPSDTDLRWPGLSNEAAKWIVNSGKIIGVGIDTPISSPGSIALQHDFSDILLVQDNIYEVNTMKIDGNLPPRFNIMVMPMKLTESGAGPTRVIAY